MRAQERQLAWVRLAVAALAVAAFVVVFSPQVDALPVLFGTLATVGAYSLAVPLLLRRFPAREVGIVSTAVEMAAVTVVVYLAPTAIDAYLFYGLVILGAALRFGLGASIWSSIVMSGLYLAVVLAGTPTDETVRALLPVRITYLIGFGVLAGLFSRLVIGRAEENARLQVRLADEEREREQSHEREALGRMARDFGASLDRDATLRTIADGAAPFLGAATLVFVVDDVARRLEPAGAAGPDAELAERWRSFVSQRPPRLGEGVVGGAGATAVTRLGSGEAGRDRRPGRAAGARPRLAARRSHPRRRPAARRPRDRGSRRDPRPDPSIVRMAEGVAERAGPALQNAQLWSDLQERMAAPSRPPSASRTTSCRS
jgi:hypothetical protein